MNFDLSQEQQIFEETVSKLLGAHADRRPDASSVWQDYASVGLLGMSFNDAFGGFGTGPVETMIVMRAIGKHLCTSPYLGSAVYGTRLLQTAGSQEQQAALIPGLIDGFIQLAVAHSEPGSGYCGGDVATMAIHDGGGFVLAGKKVRVLGGATASHFIVSARIADEKLGKGTIGLFLVARDCPGVTIEQYPTIDGRETADVAFDAVRVSSGGLMQAAEEFENALEDATDHALVAAINEAVGVMEELLSITVEYLKTRRQFGVPIGSFQALQHKAVDIFMEVEQAKSMALYATMQLGRPASERHDSLTSAKLFLNRAARAVGEASVQLHGAIGLTLESKIGKLFRRLTAFQITFGDNDACLASLLKSTPDILA
ncbi:acyl-CoA dehydrogenase family protein [Mesorhizobium sp. M0217]|uniref:acyl-CoA dehydrogenase family protein n=1 Tax=unclassified Mesorhizobium TaxID=325217 RepID=UPI0033363A2A